MTIQNKSILIYPLFILTLTVWGLILYKVIAHLSKVAGNNAEVINLDSCNYAKSKKTQSDITVILDPIKRDPFCFNVNSTGAVVNTNLLRTVTKQDRLPINYKIRGIILSDKNKLIILEDLTSTKIFFLREGDTYHNIKFKNIELLKIIVLENGEKKEIFVDKY